MNDPLTDIEQQLALHRPARAPGELRDAVLRDVGRELKSASWDRRLATMAATLLIVGISLNSTLLLGGEGDLGATRFAESERSLVEMAVAVAQATDIETARQVANQMSAFHGHILTTDQVAALDAAIAAELAKSRKG